MDLSNSPGLGFSLLFMFGAITLPIIISLAFLVWRYILARPLKKRAIFLKAPLTALILNSIFTACSVVIMLTMEVGPYPINIGALLTLLTTIFWIHDSLSWDKTKKGTKYFAFYVIGSVCLILVLVAFGAVDGIRMYSNHIEQQAENLAKVQSIGTPIYLPKDMAGNSIYISSQKPYYIEISNSIISSQYNNVSSPSKLSCELVISEYPNKEESLPRCVYIGDINGIKVWDIIMDDNYLQGAFAIVGTTTITITKVGKYDLTLNELTDYIRSLHSATNEEIIKYPISG